MILQSVLITCHMEIHVLVVLEKPPCLNSLAFIIYEICSEVECVFVFHSYETFIHSFIGEKFIHPFSKEGQPRHLDTTWHLDSQRGAYYWEFFHNTPYVPSASPLALSWCRVCCLWARLSCPSGLENSVWNQDKNVFNKCNLRIIVFKLTEFWKITVHVPFKAEQKHPEPQPTTGHPPIAPL